MSQVSRRVLQYGVVSDHPVCAAKVASRHFPTWRSHPSSRGGEFLSLKSAVINRRYSCKMVALILLFPAMMFAHHAYTAEFDTTKPVKLSGVLTKVEWSNPHVWVYLDVKDEKGNITNWGFSASPPGMLQRRGITKNSLKLGEMLTISGHRARDGSNNASGNVVTFSDGRDTFIGQDQALNPTSPTR
jgi:uncharacterized protein DUF6152